MGRLQTLSTALDGLKSTGAGPVKFSSGWGFRVGDVFSGLLSHPTDEPDLILEKSSPSPQADMTQMRLSMDTESVTSSHFVVVCFLCSFFS